MACAPCRPCTSVDLPVSKNCGQLWRSYSTSCHYCGRIGEASISLASGQGGWSCTCGNTPFVVCGCMETHLGRTCVQQRLEERLMQTSTTNCPVCKTRIYPEGKGKAIKCTICDTKFCVEHRVIYQEENEHFIFDDFPGNMNTCQINFSWEAEQQQGPQEKKAADAAECIFLRKSSMLKRSMLAHLNISMICQHLNNFSMCFFLSQLYDGAVR